MNLDLAGAFAAIPAIVWSGLFGAMLALSGVVVSNRGHNQRQRAQQEHDSREKEKARLTDLRRDVYLQVSEEIPKANAHLAALAQIDVTTTNPAEGLSGISAALAKVQLVGQPETAKRASAIGAAYIHSFLKLAPDVKPVYEARAEIRIREDLGKRASDEVQRILATMAKNAESGETDAAAFDRLNQQYDFHREQMSQYAAESREAWAKHNRAHRRFGQHLIEVMGSLVELHVELLDSIRSDLGLAFDVEAFRKAVLSQQPAVLTALEAAAKAFDGSESTESN